MTLIHFKNCAVLDTVAGVLLPGHNVVVEGETIREVSERPVKSARATAIDLKGKTLMPGLIDAHVHAMAVEVNLAVLPSLPVTLLAHQASAILAGMLRRGFTSIRDAGGADFPLPQAVEQGLIARPRMFLSCHALSQTRGPDPLPP